MVVSRRTLTIVLVAALVLYILLIPADAPREYVLDRSWELNLADTVATGVASSDRIPFHLGDRFGYLSPAGVLIHIERVRHGIAYTSDLYANYGNVVQNLVLQGPTGRIESSLGPAGYPVFADGRLFTLAGAGNIISEWDPAAGLLWRRYLPSLITSISADEDLLAVGLLSGRVLLLSEDGSIQADIAFTESRIDAVYGVDIQGDTMVVVSGLDPQFLTVYRRSDVGWQVAATRRLESRFVRPVYLELEGSSVIYETAAGAGIADDGEWATRELSVDGRLVTATSGVGGGLYALLTHDGQSAHFVLTTRQGDVLLDSRFDASAVWLSVHQGALYLGIDSAIVRLEIGLS